MTDLEHQAREMAQRHIFEIKKSKGEPSNLGYIQELEINEVVNALEPEDKDAFIAAYTDEQQLLLGGAEQNYATPDRTKIRALAEAHQKKLTDAANAGPPESEKLRIERASLENHDELERLQMEMPIYQYTDFLEIYVQEKELLTDQMNRETDHIMQKVKVEESTAAAVGTIIGTIILIGFLILIFR